VTLARELVPQRVATRPEANFRPAAACLVCGRLARPTPSTRMRGHPYASSTNTMEFAPAPTRRPPANHRKIFAALHAHGPLYQSLTKPDLRSSVELS
jgi:hypothetical protein